MREFLHLLPNGFSTPTTTTLSFVKAGYSVRFEPITVGARLGVSKIKLVSDGARFLLILLKVITVFSPLRIFLPIAGAFFVLGAGYAIWTAITRHDITDSSVLLLVLAVVIFLVGLVSEQISDHALGRTAMNAAVVIATYNERENLAGLVSAILAAPRLPRHRRRRQFSRRDRRAGRRACAKHASGRMSVIHRTGARGLGRSLVAGLKRALTSGADLIFQMDADFSHDPKYLPAMAAAAGDADLVLGSRYLHGVSVVNWPLHRIILSSFANRYIRAVTGLEVTRLHDGIPVLAARGARQASARRADLRRLRVPGRAAASRQADRLPRAGSADHLRRAARGLVEDSRRACCWSRRSCRGDCA